MAGRLFLFMKEIIAIIRPQKWAATKARLMELGVMSFTTCRVYGRGRQNGVRYVTPQGGVAGMRTVPKRLVWLWLPEELVPEVIDALIEVNRTGAIGDGKIFICPMEDALRLRTGDRGELAVH